MFPGSRGHMVDGSFVCFCDVLIKQIGALEAPGSCCKPKNMEVTV